MSEAEADAAALRRAFNRAAESGWPASVAAHLDRTPTGREELAKLTAWWGQFYAAVRDTTAGLALLAELQRLRELDAFRLLELADTDATLTEMEERYRELQERVTQLESALTEANRPAA